MTLIRSPRSTCSGALALGLLLAASALTLSASPASANPSFGQNPRCDGDAAFDDLTITNPDAPLKVDVRLAGNVVINNLDLPTGKTVATVPYLPPPPDGAVLEIVEHGSDAALASAPLAERPECGDSSITIENSSRCAGDDLKLVLTVVNAGPGSYSIDVLFGGGPVAEGLALGEGTSKEVVIDFPTDLTPETQHLATIEVQNSANGERLAFKQMDARGRVCHPTGMSGTTVAPKVPAPVSPVTPGAPAAPAAPAPATPIHDAPAYTG